MQDLVLSEQSGFINFRFMLSKLLKLMRYQRNSSRNNLENLETRQIFCQLNKSEKKNPERSIKYPSVLIFSNISDQPSQFSDH